MGVYDQEMDAAPFGPATHCAVCGFGLGASDAYQGVPLCGPCWAAAGKPTSWAEWQGLDVEEATSVYCGRLAGALEAALLMPDSPEVRRRCQVQLDDYRAWIVRSLARARVEAGR